MTPWLAAIACAVPGWAVACSFTGWDAVNTTGSASQVLIVGSPTSATSIPRYSGPCAAMARGPGNYVTDVLTVADWAYHARFYVFVDVPANEVEFFRATNNSGQPLLTIRQNLTTLKFDNAAGVTTTSPVVPGRWYSIELDWYAGRALTVEIRGAGQAVTPRLTAGLAVATERVAQVSLGWISGAGTGRVVVDDYLYRRFPGWEYQTALGHRCRGETDASNLLSGDASADDLVRIRNEAIGLGLAARQPDCNEDGLVNAADLTCVSNDILAALQCNENLP